MAAHATDTEYRIEHDTMGEVRVPIDALIFGTRVLDRFLRSC